MSHKNSKRVGIKTKKLILLLLLTTTFILSFIKPANAELVYDIQREYVHVTINKNGTIDLYYSLDIIVRPEGDPQKGIYIRMPNENVVNQSAIDEQGHQLVCDFETAPYPRLKILWDEVHGVLTNTTITVKANASINTNMFYNDTETYPGNVAMKFTLAYWDDVKTKTFIHIYILLPEGVNRSDIAYSPYENAFFDETNGTKNGMRWTRSEWPVNSQFEVMVSFPAEYMNLYLPLDSGGDDGTWITILLAIVAVAIVAVVVYIIVTAPIGTQTTTPPPTTTDTFGHTTLNWGIRSDLTAVEAAVLLGYPQDKVIKMIIHVLIGEDVVRAISTRPLKLEVLDQQVELKYWEQQLIQAIRVDGTLDREALPRIISNVRRGVSLKMQEYNDNTTKNHYRNRVEQRMEMIEASLRIQLEG